MKEAFSLPVERMEGTISLPNAKKVLVAGHKNPDGDSLASCAALHNYYKERGSNVKVAITGKVAGYINWIIDDIEVVDDPFRFKPELLIVVDTAADSLSIGLDIEKLLETGTRVIGIDHHDSPRRKYETHYLSGGMRDKCSEISDLLETEEAIELVHKHKVSTASILTDYFGLTDPILYVGIRCDSSNFQRKTLDCMRMIPLLNIRERQIQEYNEKLRSSSPKNPLALEYMKQNGLIQIGEGDSQLHLIVIQEDSKHVAQNLLQVMRMFYKNIGVVWKRGISFRTETMDIMPVIKALGGGGYAHSAASSRVTCSDVELIKDTIERYLLGKRLLLTAPDTQKLQLCWRHKRHLYPRVCSGT